MSNLFSFFPFHVRCESCQVKEGVRMFPCPLLSPSDLDVRSLQMLRQQLLVSADGLHCQR